MDPIFAIVFLIVLLMGSLMVSNFNENRRNREKERALAAKPPEPICGCKHHLAFHGTGPCLMTAKQIVKWARDPRLDDPSKSYTAVEQKRMEAMPVEWAMVQCPCPGYVGPEPIINLYSPDLATGGLYSPDAMEPPSQREIPKREITPEMIREADRRLRRDPPPGQSY